MSEKSINLELTAKDLEIERLRKALELVTILHLRKTKEVHLGRPRSTDLTCISCVSYIVLNDGAYGESISTQDLERVLLSQTMPSQEVKK